MDMSDNSNQAACQCGLLLDEIITINIFTGVHGFLLNQLLISAIWITTKYINVIEYINKYKF